MKKLLAIVISMAMLVAMMPMGVFAETPAAEKVAKIGEEEYGTLEAAAAVATNGQTIELLGNLSDIGKIDLPAGVTLDGKNKKISGNSAINVNAGGGTVKNISFENIHDNEDASTDECNRYGWKYKKGKLSAIYAKQLNGKLEVSNCTFDNVDWDAIQITPINDADINIHDNTFKMTNKDSLTVRYIHIESDKNVDFKVEVTKNKLYDGQKLNQTGSHSDSAIFIAAIVLSTLL